MGKKYERRLARIKRDRQRYEQEKELWDQRQELKQVKRSMRTFKLPTTTKLIVAYIFLNCSAVEAYSMTAMWKFQNLDALYSLIAAVVSESISFAVYAAKAYCETREEQRICLERDKMAADQPEENTQAMG